MHKWELLQIGVSLGTCIWNSILIKGSNSAQSECQSIRVWLGICGKTIHSCDARVESGKSQGFLLLLACLRLSLTALHAKSQNVLVQSLKLVQHKLVQHKIGTMSCKVPKAFSISVP